MHAFNSGRRNQPDIGKTLCPLTAMLYHLSNFCLPKTINGAVITLSLTFPNAYVPIISQTGCWELLESSDELILRDIGADQ